MALTPWGINLNGYGFVINALEGIMVAGDVSGAARGKVVWVVSANTSYAIYVELGTSRQVAQPYLFPSAREVARNVGSYAKQTSSLEELIEVMAKAIRDKARQQVPVDTGRLRDSIIAERVT